MTHAKSANRTKDDLKALQVDLKNLALTNRGLIQINNHLSLSNNTLAITIARISGTQTSSTVSTSSNATSLERNVVTGRSQRARTIPSAATMPSSVTSTDMAPATICASSPDIIGSRLHRCKLSVQQLVGTIESALRVWQGSSRNSSTDILGSYTKVVADLALLPKELQCEQCTGIVAWSQLDPSRSSGIPCGACVCPTRRASPSLWKSCGRLDSDAAFGEGVPPPGDSCARSSSIYSSTDVGHDTLQLRDDSDCILQSVEDEDDALPCFNDRARDSNHEQREAGVSQPRTSQLQATPLHWDRNGDLLDSQGNIQVSRHGLDHRLLSDPAFMNGSISQQTPGRDLPNTYNVPGQMSSYDLLPAAAMMTTQSQRYGPLDTHSRQSQSSSGIHSASGES